MTKIKILFYKSVFWDGSEYQYLLWKQEQKVCFLGKETRDRKVLFCQRLSSIPLSEKESLDFVRSCAESITHPCMIRELLCEQTQTKCE